MIDDELDLPQKLHSRIFRKKLHVEKRAPEARADVKMVSDLLDSSQKTSKKYFEELSEKGAAVRSRLAAALGAANATDDLN